MGCKTLVEDIDFTELFRFQQNPDTLFVSSDCCGSLGLLNHDLPPEELDDILTDMVDESDRLIRLVNNLLRFAHADPGWSLVKEPLEIHPVIEEIARQVRLLDLNRQINLDVPAELEIIGDRDAFKQVIMILLDNAIKHSNGRIEVQAHLVDSGVEIRVRDYGEGIAPDVLSHVFDRFYSGEDRVIVEGFRLGLPIAKTLVEGMGGEISIESELGKGSILTSKFLATQER